MFTELVYYVHTAAAAAESLFQSPFTFTYEYTNTNMNIPIRNTEYQIPNTKYQIPNTNMCKHFVVGQNAVKRCTQVVNI